MSSLENSNVECPWLYCPIPLPTFSKSIPEDRIFPKITDPDINIWSLSLLTSPFPRSSPLPKSISIENMTPNQCRLVSQGLALHVLVAEDFVWPMFQDIVREEDRVHSLRKKFFKIFASFALRIYGPEDFVRLVEVSMIKKNALDFCRDIEDKYGADDLAELVSTGKMKVEIEKYPFLWQQDVDFILWSYQKKSQRSRDSMEENYDSSHDSVVEKVAAYYDNIISEVKRYPLHKHYVDAAYEAIKDPNPLQEEEKLDLMLNAANAYHVFRQALYLESWRSFKEEDVDSLRLEYCGPNHDEIFILSFHYTLDQLARRKAYLISLSEEAFRYVTENHILGNFNNEVVKAVRVANFERMRLGYRFLTTDHLLCGLSKSRVGDKMKVFEKTWIPTREDRDLGEINLLYIILKLSCDVASRLGHEEVLLEHLYLATMFGTRILPAKKKRIDGDGSEELIDWNSVLEQGAIKEFLLKESAAEPERQQQLCGKIKSKEALWVHFFGAECTIPLTPRGLLKILDREFREKKFKPLESCVFSSTKNPRSLMMMMQHVFLRKNTVISLASLGILNMLTDDHHP